MLRPYRATRLTDAVSPAGEPVNPLPLCSRIATPQSAAGNKVEVG